MHFLFPQQQPSGQLRLQSLKAQSAGEIKEVIMAILIVCTHAEFVLGTNRF